MLLIPTLFEKFNRFYTQSERLILSYSFLVGFLTIFASAPFFWYIFLLMPFGFLADILYKSTSVKQRLFRLTLFLLGYHLANFYWILHALTVDIAFYWIIPFAAVFICGTFALMFLFAAIPYLVLSKRFLSPWFHYLGIAFSWILFEFIKEYFPFGGLPWQGIGMIFATNDYVIQIAYYIGIFGCHILTILLALLPFIFLRAKFGKFFSFIGFAFVIILLFFGYFRIDKSEKNQLNSLPILGVQGNVPVEFVYHKTNEDISLIKYIKQSQIAKEMPNDIILVWPESTVDFYTDTDIENRKMFIEIMSFLPKNVKYLIFGSGYFNRNNNEIFNRMSVINRHGELIYSYDKRKLAPFGEYIPTRNFFPFLTKKITKGMLDLSVGKEYNLLQIEGVKIAPIICFESIFARRVIDAKKVKKADAILQISDDVWFGNSNGPYQHLVFSKFLAVIYKVPVIRVANTGISSFYNEYGQLLQYQSLNTSGFINVSNLPKKMS